MKTVIAIDLGASSGRVMAGHLDEGRIRLEEAHRFSNQQVQRDGHSCWDLYSILEEIKVGINRVVATYHDVCSLGIDTWGVDFVLLDQYGTHLGNFVSYRDARTQGVQQTLQQENHFSPQDIYTISGIQFLPFNTIYQLKAIADERPAWFDQIDTLLFVPDYLNYKLCGVKHCEYTNASTSQLLDCQDKTWNSTLVKACGANLNWFLPPKMPNRMIGQYQHGDIQIPVCSVASHDTASAVAATPLSSESCAYLSSGTWSLIGVESQTPCLNEKAFEYNLTNEGGVDGRYRILKNIMGLWLIQRIKAENPSLAFSDVKLLAQNATPFEFICNPNDDSFLNPNSMTEAIVQWFTTRDLPAPTSLAQIVRCIYDSLALAYSAGLHQLSDALERPIEALRIVGGGTQDHFLNQLCADVCQIPVVTEPTEASALGNVMNQFIALDAISCLEEGRQIIEACSDVKHYQPSHIEGLEQIKAQFELLK